jgi:hypothetical protein
MAGDALPRPGTGQDAALPHSERKPSIRELELEEWTWRIGPEAAAHKLATNRWSFRTWLCGAMGFVLAFAGIKVGTQPIWIAGVVAYAASIYCMYRGWTEVTRTRQAIRKSLGVPVNRHHPPPPNRVAHYLAWCKKYDLPPYPFRPPGPAK